MTQIKSQIVLDSVNPDANRITTFKLTYPRFIHSELMTHRVFSRNAASSRAIPIVKTMEQAVYNPAKPIRWGKGGKGMQDHGELEEFLGNTCDGAWRNAAFSAYTQATTLAQLGLHKQIVNRVLEPFLWMETLVTATEFENFFALRVHKDAQPEFQHLAYLMLEQYVEGPPPNLVPYCQWHIPFGDQMPEGLSDADKIKVATARAARLSYLTMDGAIDVQKDIELHDRLAASGHWSPFEHCAVSEPGSKFYGNLRGWIPYRKTFTTENRKVDLRQLLKDYRESKSTH